MSAAVSALRTIVVPAQKSGYGVPSPTALVWPVAQPDDVLDYGFDVTAPLADVSDSIASATAAVQPSGAGELQASALAVSGDLISLWLGGGVGGRVYLVRVDAQTVGGRIFSWVVRLPISLDLAASAVPPPPDAGFGPQVAYAVPPWLAFNARSNSALLALI